MQNDYRTEVNQAIYAGENALASLKDAKSYLNSAGNWGLLDIFGGKNISGVVKHLKISKANNALYKAKTDLNKFRKELDDIDDYIPDIEVGTFLTFADFFFDGFLADIIVQSKIGEMKRQIDKTISNTEEILRRLRRL